jgi:hypothetical protein
MSAALSSVQRMRVCSLLTYYTVTEECRQGGSLLAPRHRYQVLARARDRWHISWTLHRCKKQSPACSTASAGNELSHPAGARLVRQGCLGARRMTGSRECQAGTQDQASLLIVSRIKKPLCLDCVPSPQR